MRCRQPCLVPERRHSITFSLLNCCVDGWRVSQQARALFGRACARGSDHGPTRPPLIHLKNECFFSQYLQLLAVRPRTRSQPQKCVGKDGFRPPRLSPKTTLPSIGGKCCKAPYFPRKRIVLTILPYLRKIFFRYPEHRLAKEKNHRASPGIPPLHGHDETAARVALGITVRQYAHSLFAWAKVRDSRETNSLKFRILPRKSRHLLYISDE